MRLAARKFAVVLWIGSVITAIYVWMDISHSIAIMNTGASGSLGQVPMYGFAAIGFVQITIRSGGLALLGVIIWVLGDIRDQLAPPE